MNNIKIFSVFIFICVLLIALNSALTKRTFAKKTEIALEDYSMLPDDIKVTDKVILGRGDDRYRPGAISLICTNQNNILLIVQDRKPTRHGKVGGLTGEGFFSGSNIDGYKRKKTEISNMTYLFRGYFDVYISDPLSRQETNSILETMKIEGLVHIGINVFDGGAAFSPEFSISQVEQLVDFCQ